MYMINKKFEFSYAHRVHNQALTGNKECSCRRIHGHNGVITVELGLDSLTRDMVLDYNELNFFKKFIDTFIDHRLIIDENDPMFSLLIPSPYHVVDSRFGFSKICKQGEYESDAEKELFDSIVLISCCPTSENFCKMIYDALKNEVACVFRVSWSETGKTDAYYYEKN